jgi:spermidine synthase
VGTLVGELPELSVTSVDPRRRLSAELEARLPVSASLQRLHDDPLAHLASVAPSTYDIVILPLGESGSYRGSRLLGERALGAVQRALKPGGVLHVVTHYDTDRYVSEENARVLSVIYATLNQAFARIIVWPGDATLFLAGDTSLVDHPVDSITGRLAHLPYQPQFVSEDYLFDRLQPLRVERLLTGVHISSTTHRVERPILATLQTAYRSKAQKVDRWLATFMTDRKPWPATIPLAILLALLLALRGPRSRQRVGLIIYFTAGVTSLALELLSFYVFQSTMGSLYSDLALLIGAFMLGLAAGTWSAMRTTQRYFEQGTFVLLIAATLIFVATCLRVPAAYALAYHVLFQFSVALCTGGLFVVATRRCYRGEPANRGLGYACELGGSALSALLVTSVLLPTIGLQPLLLSLAVLAGLVMVGGLLSRTHY